MCFLSDENQLSADEEADEGEKENSKSDDDESQGDAAPKAKSM